MSSDGSGGQSGDDGQWEDDVEKAVSADGTTIAYDAWGTGPLVVIIGGAFNDRNTWAGLAQALAEQGFTGVSYDRRGRGDSGNTEPYAVEREVEDLAAVIAATGGEGPTYAHGVSSGAALLFRAVAAGLPVTRISVLEPPYRTAGAPPAPAGYIATLRRFVDADDRTGLVEYFQTQVIGLPVEMVRSFQGTPMWDALCALAPTLVYDGLCLGGDDQSLPTDLFASVRVPVLAVTSSGTALPWLGQSAEHVAGALPAGEWVRLEGGFHEVPPQVLAPALAAFYRG
jgi:pimeloyl-ACP methyl ester carboxylesterase